MHRGQNQGVTLKQAPNMWYENITNHLLKLSFKHYNLDDTIQFVNKVGGSIVFLVVYVDDLLMMGNNESYIESMKKYLKKGFEMTNLGNLHYYLGIKLLSILSTYSSSPKRSMLENF